VRQPKVTSQITVGLQRELCQTSRCKPTVICDVLLEVNASPYASEGPEALREHSDAPSISLLRSYQDLKQRSICACSLQVRSHITQKALRVPQSCLPLQIRGCCQLQLSSRRGIRVRYTLTCTLHMSCSHRDLIFHAASSQQSYASPEACRHCLLWSSASLVSRS